MLILIKEAYKMVSVKHTILRKIKELPIIHYNFYNDHLWASCPNKRSMLKWFIAETCFVSILIPSQSKFDHCSYSTSPGARWVCGWDARPTPPPAPGEMAAPGRPGPENFQLWPALPRPTPEKEGAARPTPPQKLPRGKNRGKHSYIIKSFWESKTFDQYF